METTRFQKCLKLNLSKLLGTRASKTCLSGLLITNMSGRELVLHGVGNLFYTALMVSNLGGLGSRNATNTYKYVEVVFMYQTL